MSTNIDISQITKELEKTILDFKVKTEPANIGRILTLSDGVCFIDGLTEAGYGEILDFSGGLKGLVMNLEPDRIGAIVLGSGEKLKEGSEVRTTGKTLTIGAGEDLLGRVINPLGIPLDGKGSVRRDKEMPLEKAAAGVIERQSVSESLSTGLTAIDALVPIGRGQRELIIGDRGLGKTAIAMDAIINQKNTGVVCIYVAIGQKQSKVAQLVARLEQEGVLSNTIIVSASAAAVAALQYIAPYAGCALGEYFMEAGKHALVIYDDLSKHAWAYRQLSLLLKRPSGREAYPGDIFYLHSRLLERAAKMSDRKGGGSLTALPIVETQAGDLSAYIPTNIISITDGQIFLDADLFNAGVRPAINVGLSVSRVGGAAQEKAMKQVAGKLKLELAQFRELATFAQFGADLDKNTQEKLNRGSRLMEVIKQPQFQPLPLEKQVILLLSATEGLWDETPVAQVKEKSDKMLNYFETAKKDLLTVIAKEKKLSPVVRQEIVEAIREFIRSL